MKCETCFGIGEVLIDGLGNVVARLRDAVLMVPCPECGGSGVTHCCEGLRACPERDGDDA